MYTHRTADDWYEWMIEDQRRWCTIGDTDDMNVVLALVRTGLFVMDPSCSVIRMTGLGITWSKWRSQDWHENRFPNSIGERMTVAQYARRKGVAASTVRRACKGRLKFATGRSGKIDVEIADALWDSARRIVGRSPRDCSAELFKRRTAA